MISVCLASFNGSAYIAEQIKSILIQLKSHDELIISDDKSTDDTLNIIFTFRDDRIKVLPPLNNRLGVHKNFERLIKTAKGDIIFLADQDDIWLPDKVTFCLKALKSNILVVTNCAVTDLSLNIIHNSFFKLRKSNKGFIKNFYKNSYLGCCMAFNRNLIKSILPFPSIIPTHDIWIGLIAESIGRVSFLSRPLLLYRRHKNNYSPTLNQNNRFSITTRIYHRLIFLIFFILRFFKIKIERLF